MTLAVVCILAVAAPKAGIAAEAPQTNSFLKLTHEQRYWWIHGAVTTTAHLVAMRDQKKGDCASQWFLQDRAGKQKLVEDTMTLNPSELPTTVVLGLLTRACGELSPK